VGWHGLERALQEIESSREAYRNAQGPEKFVEKDSSGA